MDTGYINAGGEVAVINESGVSQQALDPYLRELSFQLSTWTQETQGRKKAGGLFNRQKFIAPENPYAQMKMAKAAVTDDDIVSAAADVTEALALQEVRWESPNADLADVFNQLNATLDLDTYLRTMYRELFTYSQSVSATFWGYKEFLPRTRKKGGASKRKAVRLFCPQQVITLDPLKVVPVGQTIFGDDRLAWNATPDEANLYSGTTGTLRYDAVMEELFLGKYNPGKDEAAELTELGVNPRGLIEFNPNRVWRHSVTKSAHERFPDVRLRSVFRPLDLKQQLMEADRVNLVGAANYILLVKKGSDSLPGQPEEISNLKENFKVIARLPVIVSDHRLEIEIITPSTDYTLKTERYQLLDERLAARALGSITVGQVNEAAVAVSSRMIARGLENRRHMMRRSVEKHVLSEIWNHPANADALRDYKPDEKPSLAFTPRHVALDNDSVMVQAIIAARQSEEISRPSFLEWMGFDEDVEARRRERSEELYPDWQLAVPFSAQGDGSGKGAPPSAQGSQGARGGRPAGGGSTSKSAQAQVKPRTPSGAPSTRK